MLPLPHTAPGDFQLLYARGIPLEDELCSPTPSMDLVDAGWTRFLLQEVNDARSPHKHTTIYLAAYSMGGD